MTRHTLFFLAAVAVLLAACRSDADPALMTEGATVVEADQVAP
jgi:hypothetical protein